MMELSPVHLLWLLVLVPLALLIVVSAFLGRFHSSRSTIHPANIYRCDHCRRVYVDERKVPISRCPGCRRLNESLRR